MPRSASLNLHFIIENALSATAMNNGWLARAAGLLVGILVFASQVPPKQAVENLRQWGMPILPDVLAVVTASTGIVRILIAGVGVLIVAAAAAPWGEFVERLPSEDDPETPGVPATAPQIATSAPRRRVIRGASERELVHDGVAWRAGDTQLEGPMCPDDHTPLLFEPLENRFLHMDKGQRYLPNENVVIGDGVGVLVCPECGNRHDFGRDRFSPKTLGTTYNEVTARFVGRFARRG